jgi:hypothetical protein
VLAARAQLVEQPPNLANLILEVFQVLRERLLVESATTARTGS